jgi:hypothetical protein
VSVVKGGVGIRAGFLKSLEIVVRDAVDGGRIGRAGVASSVAAFTLLQDVLGMGDALVVHLMKCRWHFHEPSFGISYFGFSTGTAAGLSECP